MLKVAPATPGYIVFFVGTLSFAQISVTGAFPPPRTEVGKNVHVSQAHREDVHDEVWMAAHPTDASRLLACAMILNSSGPFVLRTVAYTSFDGGQHWTPAEISKEHSQDPACTYDKSGSAYVSSVNQVNYSSDGGKTWQLSHATGNGDRDFIVADNGNSKYSGTIYRSTTALWGIRLSRSLDGGRTFQPAIENERYHIQRGGGDGVDGDQPDTGRENGNTVVLSDGTVVGSFFASALKLSNWGPNGPPGPVLKPNATFLVTTSADGGESLTPPVVVSDVWQDWRPVGDSPIPSLAADASTGVFKDRLYAVWSDGRFGQRDHILLSYSSDKGKTWSVPRIVDDDRRPHEAGALEQNAVVPEVAVNRDGVVGVSWYDRRDNEIDEVAYTVRFAASLDGGQTFTTSVVVSEESRRPVNGQSISPLAFNVASGSGTVRVFRREWVNGGHTAGLCADARGVFHVLWVDDRTGIHQVWTAPVTVTGTAVPHGSPVLASLRDLKGEAILDVLTTRYDASTQQVRMTVRLRNVSNETLSAPFFLRALRLDSDVSTSGTVSVMQADNGIAQEGAVWDLSPLVYRGALAPNAASNDRELIFELPSLRTIRPGLSYLSLIGRLNYDSPFPKQVLNFDFELLGGLSTSLPTRSAK